MLLEMMRRKSSADFNKFVECLEKTNQKHVAVLLTEAASTYINEENLHFIISLTFVIVKITNFTLIQVSVEIKTLTIGATIDITS